MNNNAVEEYAFDILSTPENPRIAKRRRVETTSGATQRAAQARQPTCCKVNFFSSLHNGVHYGGSSQACCHQFKLADRLYLALYSRGRAHNGSVVISFTTAPSDPAGGGRSCTYAEWKRSWGADVTVAETTTIRSNETPKILADCGLTIVFSSTGRSAQVSLLVLDAPMQKTCNTCKIIPIGEVAAAHTEHGLTL